jgi:hypothetical protein
MGRTASSNRPQREICNVAGLEWSRPELRRRQVRLAGYPPATRMSEGAQLLSADRLHSGRADLVQTLTSLGREYTARQEDQPRRAVGPAAQALLDRLWQPRAVGAQRVELVGVLEQPEQQAAERVVGGLGAGRCEQPEERVDRLVERSAREPDPRGRGRRTGRSRGSRSVARAGAPSGRARPW